MTRTRRLIGTAATAAFWALCTLPALALPVPFAMLWTAVVGLIGLLSIYAAWTFSPWLPTPRTDRARILSHLPLGAGDLFIELGSGDGAMLVEVTAKTGARCRGIEISPILWALGSLRLLATRTDGVIHLGDLRTADLSEARAVYVWGTAHGMGHTRLDTLGSGAVFVSRAYPVPGVPPHKVDRDGDVPLYIYRGP